MIEFRALGSLGVTIEGRGTTVGGPRQRRLLAMLTGTSTVTNDLDFTVETSIGTDTPIRTTPDANGSPTGAGRSSNSPQRHTG